MPGTISHALSMTSPNDPLYENQPKHWNSSHLFTLNAVGSEISGAFGNAGGVTFGYDGTNVTAAAGTAAPSPVNISAGTTSNNLGSIVFGDSNGISFGLGTGASSRSITATVQTNYQSSNANYLTSQSNQAISASNGSFTFQTAAFSNANGVTFGTSAGSIVSASVNTSYRASNDALGLNTAQTNVTWTADSRGLSINAGGYAGTASGFTGANISATITLNSVGLSLSLSGLAALTSQSNQALSASNGSFTFQTAAFSNANGVTFGTSAGSIVSASVKTDYAGTGTSATNASITLNTAGLAISVAAGGGVNPVVSNSAGSFSFTTLNFSNANNVTWGTSAGSIVTASVAAPGAAAEANAINLLGANTAGNTTATGSTIGWSGVNLTLSGTNNSQVVVSAPATSSLVGTSGISISTNGSTISVLQLAIQEYDPYPLYNGVSTAFATQALGAWFVAPFVVDNPIAGGRINRMIVNGATGSILRATTSASFQAATTGTKSAEYQYSNSVVLYSLGAGTNSTRLESFWSNQFSFDMKHSVSITSGVGATTCFVGESGTISYLSAIDSAGNTTTNSFNSNGNATSNGSSINSTAISSVLNSIRNMLSGSMQIPVGFNTTINPGNYWLAQAWSTNSTTGGSSESVFSQASTIGVLMAQLSVFRMFPQTTTNVSSQYMPGRGVYSASQSNPPTTMAFSDIRTWASDIIPYFNFVNSQISV
jgi:hypothetical protein